MEDIFGFVAAALVLNTFAMQCMVKLKYCAIASNIAFVAYGMMEGLVPVLVLHALLLPLNCLSLIRMKLAANEALLSRCAARQALRSALLYRFQTAG